MKRVVSACIALALGAAYAASDSEFLLWMVESPDVVKDDVTMTFADFSALNKVNSARVAVSGGGLSGDTYLNIYTTADGEIWTVSDSPYMEVTEAGLAGPIWSGLGDYNSSVYSFTIELGNYDLTSEAWTLLARSETASYQKLRDEWSTNTSVLDVPGTIEWTGGAYTAVPEPSGGMLFLLGGMILALRRRRPAVSARVSRPLVAVLALGLVFSSTAATLDPEGEGPVVVVPQYAASSWTGDDFKPAENNVFAGITPVLAEAGDVGDNEQYVNQASSNVGILTDKRVVWNEKSGQYAVRDRAEIVFSLPAAADISEFRFYSSWTDNGRAGIAVASIEVQTAANGPWTAIDGSAFRLCATGVNTIPNGPQGQDPMARRVRFFDQNEGMLATNVVAVRISFGDQDNGWSGYAEIEAVGTPSHIGDDPLPSDVVAISTNTFGMATIYSSDTNTIVAVPWTWYSRREEDAGAIFAEKLVSPENLSTGDFLVLLTDATGNATSKAAGYAAWTLDENLKWQPTATVACAPDGGVAHTTVLAGSNDTIARGYGIWLLRTNPLNEDGTPKPFHVYGQFVSQGATVTVKGGGSRTAPVFTMLADPYLREVKVNEDIAWGSNPGTLDSLAIVTDQTTFRYCKWNGTQWWYSKVTYDEKKGVNVTTRVTDIRVPAGAGFWYVRRTDGDFNVTWGENR